MRRRKVMAMAKVRKAARKGFMLTPWVTAIIPQTLQKETTKAVRSILRRSIGGVE